MASKGRKAQAKAAQNLNALVAARPLRQALPTVGINSVNGANAQNLGMYRLRARPLTPDELAAWDKAARAGLGAPPKLGLTADEVLRDLVKEFPASVTFLPADPEEDWATAGQWLATTGAPNYTPIPGRPVREIDPEKTAEGASPLLAALALLEDRIVKKLWAFSGRMPIPSGDPRVQHFANVADWHQRNNLPFG